MQATPTKSLLPLGLALAALAAPAAAQQRSDAAVRDEIEFARGLASDWGFVDMAQSVLQRTEAEGVSERMSEELALLKCELYFTGAKNNAERRDELLKGALQAYRDFVERYTYSGLKDVAESQLVSVASYYARALALRLDEATGEEGEAIRAELQSVLSEAITKSNELVSGLTTIPIDERSEADSQRLFDLLLNMGNMYLELAKTQDEPAFSFAQSAKAFEDLIAEAGEASPAGLRAFVGLGESMVAQGEYEDAASFFEYVVDLAIPRDKAVWEEVRKDMTPEEVEKRFLFVQLATEGLVDSLARAGLYEDAAGWGLHFYNTWKREGLNLQQPLGYLSLLAVARTLVDAGGFVGGDWGAGEGQWFATREEMAQEFPGRRQQNTALEVALSMAETVNEDNRGNTLQIRAQKVISEIISRPGVEVDPTILFEAAQGAYYAREYPRAIEALKDVLAVLEHADTAARIEIGPKVIWHLGRCYQNEDRLMEAAVTFRAALERYNGDPDYDARNAQGFYDTMRVLQRQIRGDAQIDGMYKRSEQLVAEYNEKVRSDIKYQEADKAYDAERFDEARRLFAEVPVDAQSYEKAQVFVGVCAYKLDDLDGAEEVFDRYINTYLADPAKQLRQNDGVARARRAEAEATAVFFWGLSAFKRADGAHAAQPGAGADHWRKVVELYDGYEERFPDQTSYAPAALYRLMVAYDRLDDRPQTRRVYELMLKLFPDDRWTGMASVESYRSLKERYENESDAQAQRTILREMAENLQVLNRTAARPSYNNMKTEAGHWMDLDEWATAEELLKRIVARFGEEESEDIDKLVRPKLGEALLMQDKPQEAAEVLAPLVDSKKATRRTAQTYGRALAGWAEYVEGDGQAAVAEHPGLGDQPSIEKAIDVLRQLDGVAEKWTTDWFDYKFDMLYAYYVWSQSDSKKLEPVKSQLDFISSPVNLGSTFKHEQMPEGLRQKYVWLQGQAR